MPFRQPELPYSMDNLAPRISKETLEFHYGKHHAAYVNKLNTLVLGTEFENMPIEQVIMKSSGPIFNNAAQAWNHAFYWHCLSKGGQKPSGQIEQAIKQKFGSLDGLKEKFITTSVNTFGSGWGWLVKNKDGSLSVESTSNAGNPMTNGQTPLLTCDVWEHAYYIDYRNNRQKYVETFWEMINWAFVEKNFTGQSFRY